LVTRRAKGTGSLVTRGDQRLGCYVTVGGQRVYAWCPRDDNTGRRQEAELRRLLNARDAHRLSRDARQTAADYLTHWLSSRSDLAPTTRSSYEAAIRCTIITAIGATPLGDLTPLAIEAWLRRLGATHPGAAVKAKAILSSALTDAVRLGLLPSNPARSARVPRRAPGPRPVLAAAEVQRLLDATTSERLGALVVCAALLGLRRGELLGLRWADVDLDAGTLRITVQRRYEVGHGMVEVAPKADSNRELTLPRPVVDALRRHQAGQATERGRAGRDWLDHGLVFANTRGRPHWQDHTSRLLRRCLVRAGLPHRRLHDLRHGIVSWLLDAGVPITVVQQVAGHRSLVTTARYAHAMPGAGAAPARLVEAALDAVQVTG
jgi:integrase